jgi:surface antigen
MVVASTASTTSSEVKVPKRGRIIFRSIGARSAIKLVRAAGSGLALTGNVDVAHTWRGGVAVGKLGSNVLAVHACYYACAPSDAEYHNLGNAKRGDRVVKKWDGGKVVGKVTRIYRKVAHRPKKFWSDMYEWGGEKRLAYFIKCTEPDGQGHYRQKLVVKVRFGEPKKTSSGSST